MEIQGKTDIKSDKHIMDNIEDSQIQKMFSGSSILLTGGTGFLGKLMVEKLLRCCPKIKKIFLLTRPKKNKEIMKRLQEQFDDVLYDKLRKQMPDFIEKISIIQGDMGKPDLGISEEDRNNIINELFSGNEIRPGIQFYTTRNVLKNGWKVSNIVSQYLRSELLQALKFIFHGAATVRFDEALKTAVAINVRGTREILLLARSCTKLRAHVHISTAYSNCPLREIGEKFYDRNLSGDMLINLVENIDEKTLDSITPGLLGEFPNTYSYTKSAAEDIVRKYSQGLPVAVFRPSIVISTAQEPVPGWIDNVYGPTGVVVGAMIGLLHVSLCNPSVVADLVPGDFAVSGCISTAWKTAKDYAGNHEEDTVDNLPIIYNYVSSERNCLTWELFMKSSEVQREPTMQAIWMYLLWITPSKSLYNFYFFILHWIPAYIIDFFLVIIGKNPMLKKAYVKVKKFSTVVGYFGQREWKFHNGNTLKLYKEMDEIDKQTFNFDMESLVWEEYLKEYVKGVRIYLLKDPLDTIPQSRKKHFKLMLMHYFLFSLICFGLFKFVWFITKLFI